MYTQGVTELTFTAAQPEIRAALSTNSDLYVELSCRSHISIVGAFFNEQTCMHNLEHKDHLVEVELPERSATPHRIYQHDIFRKQYTRAFLCPDIRIRVNEYVSHMLDGSDMFDAMDIDGNGMDDNIAFSVKLQFVTNESVDLHARMFGYHFTESGFFYTSSQSTFWFPVCADLSSLGYGTNNCHTWDIDVSVTSIDNESGNDIICIASGDPVKQSVHPTDNSRKICSFQVTSPTSYRNISIIAGPLISRQLPGFPSSCKVTAFCPYGSEDSMEHTLQVAPTAFEFISSYIGASFPFNSWKIVFLPELLFSSEIHAYSVSMLSTHLLFDKKAIDETFETRIEIARCIANQWFGQYILPKTGTDNWIMVGIANYITSLFVKKHFGNNEYRFRLKKDMEKCFELDVEQPPLFIANSSDVLVLDDLTSEAMTIIKAPLVMYMLEKFMGGKNMMQKILNRTILSAISGELSGGLSTNTFLKSVKKVSGKEPKSFADQWIFKSGVPHLTASFFLNRKKNVIELTVKQNEEHPLFMGNMTVRVHEPDGTFDHVLAVEEKTHNFELLYHTKYRRQKQNKKSLLLEMKLEQEQLEREQAEGLLPPQGTEADEEICTEDPEIIAEFEKTEWKELDSSGNEINVPISWIRLDPNMDLICRIDFEQSDFMDAHQLAKDKDPIAQYEAVKRMHRHENVRIAACLFRCLMDVRTFYRVRMEAARSLAIGFNDEKSDGAGLRYLRLAFQKKYCISESVSADGQLVPRRNNFKAMTEYFVIQAIPEAISCIRDQHGHVSSTTLEFLTALLKLHDNTDNAYSDHAYLAALVDAIGNALSSKSITTQGFIDPSHIPESALKSCLKELEQAVFMETQNPSYHNSIALSCLRVYVDLMITNVVPLNLKPFLLFSRYGNDDSVRKVAFSALCLFGIGKRVVLTYLLSTIKSDPSIGLRSFIAERLRPIMFYANEERQDLKKAATLTNEQSVAGVEIEDFSLEVAMESQSLTSHKSAEIELLKSEEVMDIFARLLEKDAKYDDRTRRSLLAAIEAFYDPAEYDSGSAVLEVPKLKLFIKTEHPAVRTPREEEEDKVVDIETPLLEPTKLKLVLSVPKFNAPKAGRILEKLTSQQYSYFFTQPVDPIRDGVPTYFDVIKEPMDFGTIRQRLDAGHYKNAEGFERDVQLVFNNVYTFNPPVTLVYQTAKSLEKIWRKDWLGESHAVKRRA